MYRFWENSIPIYVGITFNMTQRQSQHMVSGRIALTSTIEIVLETTNRLEALELEKQLIKEHGRADQGKGPLRNRSPGGESGATGIPIHVSCPAEHFLEFDQPFGEAIFSSVGDAERVLFNEGDSTRRLMNKAVENKEQTGMYKGYRLSRICC